MDENHKITKPSLITHKKLIGNIYLVLINETINFLCNELKMSQKELNKLYNHIYKTENLDKNLKMNSVKNMRNKLVNKKQNNV